MGKRKIDSDSDAEDEDASEDDFIASEGVAKLFRPEVAVKVIAVIGCLFSTTLFECEDTCLGRLDKAARQMV